MGRGGNMLIRTRDEGHHPMKKLKDVIRITRLFTPEIDFNESKMGGHYHQVADPEDRLRLIRGSDPPAHHTDGVMTRRSELE